MGDSQALRVGSAIWFAGGGESVRSRSGSMAGTFSSLPGCEGIDLILAARGMGGGCMYIRRACLGLLFGNVAVCWSPGCLYILAHTRWMETHGSRGIKDSEGGGEANALLVVLGRISRGNFKCLSTSKLVKLLQRANGKCRLGIIR